MKWRNTYDFKILIEDAYRLIIFLFKRLMHLMIEESQSDDMLVEKNVR